MSVNILVYEHVTAGGMPGEVPAPLADAGQAMWRAVVDDFAEAGAKVWTTVGDRENIARDGRAIARITPAGELQSLVHQLAVKCDGAIIIAPETSGILEEWVRLVHSWNIPLLNCSPETIALCADKQALCLHLEKRGVPTVPTRSGDAQVLLDAVAASLRAAGGAYVVKPRDGAGCEATFVCRTLEEAEALRGRLSEGQWIAQPYIEGVAASVSFVAAGDTVRPLLPGRQRIEGVHELRYLGGRIPLERKLAERATWLASQAVRTLPDLRGFIGVDLVLTPDSRHDTVIEINPRVTMSYCGLRRLCTTNLAKAMMDAAAPIEWRRGRVTFDNAGAMREDGSS